jgi:hypothetical protein
MDMKPKNLALLFLAVTGMTALSGCAEKNSIPPRDQYAPVDEMNDVSRRAVNYKPPSN